MYLSLNNQSTGESGLSYYTPFIQLQTSHEHFSRIEPIQLMTQKKVNATVLCHFYNEEYLLPFWLKHHGSMFDHGIMIDYHSTDGSVELIKKLCPTWEIRTSRNTQFNAYSVDREVMDIETQISGYKIALNVTEFLIASKPFERTEADKCFRIESYIVIPDSSQTEPKDEKEFISHIDKLAFQTERGYRAMHSYSNGNYNVGRHSSYHPSETISSLFIVWCGFYPWNEKTLKRKLQIKDHIPESDKKMGHGFQHLWGYDRMIQEIENFNSREQTRLSVLYSAL
jgi:hypothetical protein